MSEEPADTPPSPVAPEDDKLVGVLVRYADGSICRAMLPDSRLRRCDAIRREHGEEAYRSALHHLVLEYAIHRKPKDKG